MKGTVISHDSKVVCFFNCLFPIHLVAVHLVAIFQGKYAPQRDGNAVTNNRQSEGVPDHGGK